MAERGIVVVCPFSTGHLLAERVQELGFKLVIMNLPNHDSENEMMNVHIEGAKVLVASEDTQETIEMLNELPFQIDHILPGAENGVSLADELAHAMGLRCNPIALSNARRNKYLMGETIRQAGVRSAKQTICTEWDEVESFLCDWNPDPFKVIVKPNQSAGSDDVFLCKSLEEVRAAFNSINGAINEIGEINEGVLIQEFLEGIEYVVDSVSLDGEHKVVSIWQYDKREANGQFNVYFGMSICEVATEKEQALVEYNSQILDALEIFNGPSHAEIMWTKTGPCLIEVGSRCHGGHGSWKPIANKAFGYNQIDVTLDCYVRPDLFHNLPPYPTNAQHHGKEVFLVSKQAGKISDIPGLDLVMKLPSYLSKDISVKTDDDIHKTIDLFTMPGRVQLLHESKAQVDIDYELIHAILAEGRMFELCTLDKQHQALEGPEAEEVAQ
mmetsp:Transcript_19940/g.32851  ORF Transcript_19940/g.32851 Transcript_19940/m.32851 type:complete len:441 (-) Transcript_19940:80-1402(-)